MVICLFRSSAQIIKLRKKSQQQINMRILVLAVLLAIAISCPNNCNDCDPSATICFACAEGFQLSVLGTCVDSNTIAKCDLYGPTNQCFACQATYTITNGQCLKDYSACLAFDPSDDSKCISCGFGTRLKNNACVGAINCASNTSATCTACITGFTVKGGNCNDNTGNCKTVGSNGVCSTCNSGFNLVGYSCISSNVTVYGCYVFDAAGSCQLCKAGYNLYQGNCLLPSQIQQIQQGLVQLSTVLSQRNMVSVTTTTTTTTTTTSAQGANDFGSSSFGGAGFDSGFGSGFGFDTSSSSAGFGFGGSSIPNCESVDDYGNCIACISGYFLNGAECTEVSPFCTTYNNQTGACLSCKYGLTLSSGACVDTNCLTPVSNGCNACKPLFSLNANNYCQINDPNCLQPASVICNQCAPNFFVSAAGTCSPLPLGCSAANPTTLACTACNSGYQLANGACTVVKKSSTVTSTTTSTTTSSTVTIPFCSVQAGLVCNQCLPGYQLSNNQCFVVLLPPNCQNADPTRNNYCLTCNSGYTLNNGACLQTQSPSTPFCQSYNLLTGQCIACINGYSLSGSLCIANSGSSSSSSSSTSTSTSSTSYGSSSSSSSSGSSSGGIVTISTRDPNCAKYTGAICSSCSNRYYFGSNSLCVPVNPLCNTYNSNGACSTCYPGYILQGTICIVTKQSDPYCKSYSQGGICVGCYTGYYYNQIAGLCQALNPLCKSSNLADGTCTACFPGYNLNAGICAVSFQDPNCQKFDQTNKICTQCAIKFYLDSSAKCRQVSPLCKTANQSNGACLSCYPGYVLSGATCSVGGAANSDVNCQTTNNGFCQKCYSGYFPNPSGRCIQNNPLCKTSDTNTGSCLSCYSGYNLFNGNCSVGNSPTASSDSNCKTSDQNGICSVCYSGYFLTQGMSCQKMDPLCKNYVSSFSACSACYDGYSLQSGQCLLSTQVTSQNIDIFCVKVQGQVCLACSSGYFLSATGSCAQLNPLCKNSDLTTGACLDCYPGYQLSGTTCIVAASLSIPYCSQYVGNACVACINGYYAANGTCALANVLCATYDQSSGACQSCIPGYVFQAGQCILPSLGIDPDCVQYTNSYCTQCSPGFALSNYWCNPIDPICTQYDPVTSICKACSQGKTPSGPSCI